MGLNIPRTGRPGVIGTLVTGTLLIAGESGVFTTPSGQRGAMLRAYAKSNGKEVGAVFLPAGQSGSPMTYLLNGKQYVVVAVGGAGGSCGVGGFPVAQLGRSIITIMSPSFPVRGHFTPKGRI